MADQVCPHCGRLHREEARFCPVTGKPLQPYASAPVISPVQGPGPLHEGAASLTGKLPPNYLLNNRFMILRKIGRGGMAAVYLAADTWQQGASWAIKEMSDAALSDRERGYAVTSFLQEANLLRSLNHPNLPKVIDVFTEGGKHYLVMEYVPGKTLYELLEERAQPFTEKEVLSWAIQLCDVLGYLHCQNPKIIFRDMKPSNIMITPQGQVKLIDFGIARFFKPGKTSDTMAMGTPGYAAPEAIGGQTDERSDIYSLCVTMHHLLTRHDPLSKLFQIPPVRQLNQAVSVDLERILERGSQNQRDLRWSSVFELRDALLRVGSPQPSAWGAAPPLLVFPPAGQSVAPVTPGSVISGAPRAGTWKAPEPPPSVAYPAGGYVPVQVGGSPATPGQPMAAPALRPTARPTTRLLAAAVQVSGKQMAILAVIALAIIVLGTWLLAPVLDAAPINWNKVPLIAIFGAFGYSAYPRRGVAFASHALLSSVLVVTIWAKLGSQGYEWLWLIIAALVSGGFMELWVAMLPKVKAGKGDEAWMREVFWIALMAVLGTEIFLLLVSQGAIVLDPIRLLLSAILGVIGWFLGDLLKQYMLYRRTGLQRLA